MSATVIFRGAYIRSFEYRNGENDRHVRIHITADWTDTVREAMVWDDIGEGHGGTDLIGRLAAEYLILTPSGKGLKDHQVQINVKEATKFEVLPRKDKEGETSGHELRFMVKTTDSDVPGLLQHYCATMGRGLAQLKLAYSKQEELPLDGPPLTGEALARHQREMEGATKQ